MQKQYQPGKYQPRPENEGKNALDPYGQHPLPLKNHSMRSQALSPSVWPVLSFWRSFVLRFSLKIEFSHFSHFKLVNVVKMDPKRQLYIKTGVLKR